MTDKKIPIFGFDESDARSQRMGDILRNITPHMQQACEEVKQLLIDKVDDAAKKYNLDEQEDRGAIVYSYFETVFINMMSHMIVSASNDFNAPIDTLLEAIAKTMKDCAQLKIEQRSH